MRCPHCGQEHPSNVSYCPTTGQPLPSSRGFRLQWLVVAMICIAVLGIGGLLIWNLVKPASKIRVAVQADPGESLSFMELVDQVTCQGTLTQDASSSSVTTLPAWDNPGYSFSTPPSQPVAYPHWVNYIRSLLEAQYDNQTIYNSGLTVHTTLDPWLQDKADQILRKGLDGLSQNRVTNGALVAIRPSTGEILAMVGSADFYNQSINGQFNMALSPRQPGTAIKPLVYTAAFEKGWTASTLIWDVPTEFPPSGDVNDARPPYVPANYDGRFHGPVTVRSALANSHNIPAVKALQFAGIYDDPNTPQGEGLLGVSQRLGITTLKRDDYGISLTLGGGEVSLLELTGAYAVIANGGNRIPPQRSSRSMTLKEICYTNIRRRWKPGLEP
jgi:membrane carboxypeptidase/penicillin-binding protein